MPTAYILNVPENRPVVEVARQDNGNVVQEVGPYFQITSSEAIVIDRRASGCRHAVWYSCLAGLASSTIAQWDKDALRIESK